MSELLDEMHARYESVSPATRKKHRLTFEGSGKSLMGRCSCDGGDKVAFLPGYGRGTIRQGIKQRHLVHMQNAERREEIDGMRS